MAIISMAKIRGFMENAKHVMHISYRPTSHEFNMSARIVILGILIVGILGFIISLIVGFITGAP